MKKQTKINIITCIVIAVFSLTLVAIGYIIGTNTTRKAEYEEHRQVVSYTVQQGDTLWTIAERYKPSWLDTREYICEIKALNGMDNSSVTTDTQLLLYAENKGTYTMNGVCTKDTIVTIDGNEWYPDAELNNNAVVLVEFSNNGTPNNIYDDVIINIKEVQ